VKLALAGSVVFVIACILVPEGLRSTALYSDVNVYSHYAHRMLGGQVPYRDFFDEYPPFAQPVLLAARSALAVGVFAVSPLLVGPIFLNAYDLWPTFLLVASIALFVRYRPMWGFAVLGAATAAKVYPVAILPLAVLYVPRACRARGLVWFAGVLVVTHLPFLILGPGGVRFSYTVQAKRGLELNSLGSSLLLATGHRELRNQPPGSLNVVGGTAHAAAIVSAVLVVLAIVAVTSFFARGRLPFVVACAAAVTGFVAFDKVFSAQYVEWLTPVAPLGGAVAAGLTVAVLGLTHAVFSHRSAIGDQHDVTLLVVRNLVVVVLYAVLALPRDRL
jgi:hypothetical protein